MMQRHRALEWLSRYATCCWVAAWWTHACMYTHVVVVVVVRAQVGGKARPCMWDQVPVFRSGEWTVTRTEEDVRVTESTRPRGRHRHMIESRLSPLRGQNEQHHVAEGGRVRGPILQPALRLGVEGTTHRNVRGGKVMVVARSRASHQAGTRRGFTGTIQYSIDAMVAACCPP